LGLGRPLPVQVGRAGVVDVEAGAEREDGFGAVATTIARGREGDPK
jgi:hypothetical protein